MLYSFSLDGDLNFSKKMEQICTLDVLDGELYCITPEYLEDVRTNTKTFFSFNLLDIYASVINFDPLITLEEEPLTKTCIYANHDSGYERIYENCTTVINENDIQIISIDEDFFTLNKENGTLSMIPVEKKENTYFNKVFVTES